MPRRIRSLLATLREEVQLYARDTERIAGRTKLLALNAKYGLNLRGAPRLNDPNFVYQLVFDPARGARVPKALTVPGMIRPQ